MVFKHQLSKHYLSLMVCCSVSFLTFLSDSSTVFGSVYWHFGFGSWSEPTEKKCIFTLNAQTKLDKLV